MTSGVGRTSRGWVVCWIIPASCSSSFEHLLVLCFLRPSGSQNSVTGCRFSSVWLSCLPPPPSVRVSFWTSFLSPSVSNTCDASLVMEQWLAKALTTINRRCQWSVSSRGVQPPPPRSQAFQLLKKHTKQNRTLNEGVRELLPQAAALPPLAGLGVWDLGKEPTGKAENKGKATLPSSPCLLAPRALLSSSKVAAQKSMLTPVGKPNRVYLLAVASKYRVGQKVSLGFPYLTGKSRWTF